MELPLVFVEPFNDKMHETFKAILLYEILKGLIGAFPFSSPERPLAKGFNLLLFGLYEASFIKRSDIIDMLAILSRRSMMKASLMNVLCCFVETFKIFLQDPKKLSKNNQKQVMTIIDGIKTVVDESTAVYELTGAYSTRAYEMTGKLILAAMKVMFLLINHVKGEYRKCLVDDGVEFLIQAAHDDRYIHRIAQYRQVIALFNPEEAGRSFVGKVRNHNGPMKDFADFMNVIGKCGPNGEQIRNVVICLSLDSIEEELKSKEDSDELVILDFIAQLMGLGFIPRSIIQYFISTLKDLDKNWEGCIESSIMLLIEELFRMTSADDKTSSIR